MADEAGARGDKNNDNFIDHYLVTRVYQQAERSSAQWAKLVIGVILYLLIMLLQATHYLPEYINGIFSQLQAIISVFLALYIVKEGFYVGAALNIINVIAISMAIVVAHQTSAITGLIVAVFTLIAITFIHILVNRNARQFAEVVKQKEELFVLGSELRQQNENLLQSNLVISKNEEKLNYLAYFDTLTELPNRKMIFDRLELLVNLSQNNRATFAVVFIDLDDFKKINDAMGHQVGDMLIVAVAARLNERVHKGDLLGRLGGDEFALIIQQSLRDEEFFQYVENLRLSLEKNFHVDPYDLYIRASFGISIYPQDGSTPTELIKCADTAMYKAKETGTHGINFFRKEMQADILQKMDYENKLLAALQNEEFFLAYQPQFMANTKTLRGFEALVRWSSPDYGLMSPMTFIPVAEEMGLIIPLGQWILRTACHQFTGLMARYPSPEIILSVNISALQFNDPGFVPTLKSILQESGLAAQNLELEITESVLIKSVEQTRRILNELKEMGVKIALDDFGTGYSSLRYLQILPIDTLKIDKSFVENINDQDKKKHVIGAIITLVHQMNIFVVAEGIENDMQLSYLMKEACDGFQGYLLGKPMTVPEIIKYFDVAPDCASPRR
jgi:diguanylate cyclase (GGDEF)-like protein